MVDDLRMDAYYYHFTRTGCRAVDKILSAVARAGKAYHHTDDWNEPDHDGISPIEQIQATAVDAAKHIEAYEQALEAAKEDWRGGKGEAKLEGWFAAVQFIEDHVAGKKKGDG